MTRFKIGIIVLIVLVGITIFSAFNQKTLFTPNSVIGVVFSPLQKLSANISNTWYGFYNSLASSKQTSIKNKELQSEITTLRKKLVDYEDIKQENAQMKELQKINSKNKNLVLMPSRVISRDPTEKFGGFMIDKGSSSGIQLHNSVITADGVVGKISEISLNNARVMTILNPLLKIACIEIRTKETGVLKTDVSLSEKGVSSLNYLRRDCGIAKGDIITTSKSNVLFPSEILVGSVESIHPSKQSSTLYAVITPFVDVNKVTEVFVVTKFGE
jgi:rod shape-determining protein MreC